MPLKTEYILTLQRLDGIENKTILLIIEQQSSPAKSRQCFTECV